MSTTGSPAPRRTKFTRACTGRGAASRPVCAHSLTQTSIIHAAIVQAAIIPD